MNGAFDLAGWRQDLQVDGQRLLRHGVAVELWCGQSGRVIACLYTLR